MPTLSQHHGFSLSSETILCRSDTLQIFFPLEFDPSSYIVSTNKILLKRAAQRVTLFYPLDAASRSPCVLGNLDLHASDYTSKVQERLLSSWGIESQSAAWSFRLLSRSQNEPVNAWFKLVNQAESWGSLSGAREDLNLTYSPEWLHLSLAEVWITLYNLTRKASVTANLYGLSVCLATIVFSQKLPLKDLPVLVSFAANPSFFKLDPPEFPSFQLKQDGYSPLRPRIQGIVFSRRRELGSTPAEKLTKEAGETKKQYNSRKLREYNERISEYQLALVDHYWAQWPSNRLASPPGSESYTLWFKVESCTKAVEKYFASCAKNAELRTHLREVERALSSNPKSQAPRVNGSLALNQVDRLGQHGHAPEKSHKIHLGGLMFSRPSPEGKNPDASTGISSMSCDSIPIETSRLSGLFAEFQNSESPWIRRYGHDLDTSRMELCAKRVWTVPSQLPPRQWFIQSSQLCKSYCEEMLRELEHTLGPKTPIEQIIYVSGCWPRLTPRTLLGFLSLRVRHEHDVGSRWSSVLIKYARAFVDYQHSRCMVGLLDSGSVEDLVKELDPGDDKDYDQNRSDPDWLLVQIEGNFRARSLQRWVAHEMISPSSSTNTALQLNMGEGKSSVIVPIIAAALADTRKLVRVIVPKPLWRQMFHLLVHRLSGLVHRRIYYLPFSRNVQLNSSQADKLQELYAECMREGGILLAQPEHILSFKLMEIDHLLSSSPAKQAVSSQLYNTQQWLTANARDIMDDSDEITNVQCELVHTLGSQLPLENSPYRWTITQQLLEIAAKHIIQLGDSTPDVLQYKIIGEGQYPTIHIMPNTLHHFECRLISSIVKDILNDRLLGLNFGHFSQPMRQLVLQFLKNKDISYAETQELLTECDEATQKGLLLLRGLLALGVLVSVFTNKRYRVDYGLDLSRSLLAVPYCTKNAPSLRAEFGHPDVMVLLTCLSYYYKGLTGEQLKLSFDLLYKLDNPTLEYEQWVRHDATVPNNLIRLSGVNLNDQDQFSKSVLPTFSHNIATVNFFLSRAVFPKAAKGFSYKLAVSSWDLLAPKTHVTTGFSGTNDNRYLLPTSFTQSHPVQQLSTNALVLAYLLQPENNRYLCIGSKAGESLTTEQFLKLLVGQQPEIQVLLDVGAQMLDLHNEELVRCWLSLRLDMEAAVCFNAKDELIVITRNGTTSAFYSSPYSQQLDKCIVYLDDSHTRGTDLKLPQRAHALVTLGPRVTKDRLLQGCMRMRMLGYGQSVTFAAPPEIDRQIRDAGPQPLDAKVDVLDVLRWAMMETCRDLRRHAPSWALQGLGHNRRAKAEARFLSSRNVEDLKNGWMTPESRSLEEMYGVQNVPGHGSSDTLTSQAYAITEFRERLHPFGHIVLNDSRIDEEQERELSHEVEQRQRLKLKYPPEEQPANHQLHQDILYFVRTGGLPTNSHGVMYLHRPLSPSRSGDYPWSKDLGGSVDFFTTVMNISRTSLSDFMRPVNWVLRGSSGVRLILSPFEVNELLPLIRRSEFVQLHIYAPRTMYFMRSFSDLQFYSIPHTQPSIDPVPEHSPKQLQLDLFAGQLYLPSYEAYLLLSVLLGLYNAPHGHDDRPEVQTQSDGFVMPENRQQLVKRLPEYSECRFTTSPIPMLKELIGRRRKGMEYIRTHIGQVLYSRSMTANDF